MTSAQIRQRFLDFFASKGHAVVPSSSLVPQGDSSVLFTTAGMQQFKPYYTGAKDAQADFDSLNTVSVQKCVRTGDIDEVGDDTHLTFFEMLGNFSFGGYWKKEAIAYAHEFITKELGLTIDYVSIFKDDASSIPADEESRTIWQSIDANLTIREHNREDNFWGPTGDEGPCGPTTEIYINGVEIWNIVFNEYYKTLEGKFEPLATKGIDTGMGLERLLVQVQNKNNVYETDLFNNEKTKEERIVADHIRSAAMMIADGVRPSNKDQGYIVRRLLRRAMIQGRKLNAKVDGNFFIPFLNTIFDLYKDTAYFKSETVPESAKEADCVGVMSAEADKFTKTLESGLKEFEKGTDPFILATTYGFPVELTEELAQEKGIAIDRVAFDAQMKAHQDASRAGAEQKFKGGLANTSEMTTKLHTAHHLLLKALQEVVSPDIHQKGSNITEERLRLDFNFDRKLTDEEKQKVEDLVNEKIKEDLTVTKREMPKDEAMKLGAEMEFGTTYPDIVSVYMIHDAQDKVFSQEFCGGPHVERTGVLGNFKIQKEEASSAGVRRIKATLS